VGIHQDRCRRIPVNSTFRHERPTARPPFRPEWADAFFATPFKHPNLILLHARVGVVPKREERIVAPSSRRATIDLRQQRLDFPAL
jgi:hypothetical protein